jgi:hypothetical protein
MVKSVRNYGSETCWLYEDGRRRISATETDALRRSARISTLGRITNGYIKNGRARYCLGLYNPKTTHLLWTCWENGPNTVAKNYDQLENWSKEKTRSSPKNLGIWEIYCHEWKKSQNRQIEQSKAMKYGSRKASPDIVKYSITYIYIYIYIYKYLYFIIITIQWLSHLLSGQKSCA